MKRILVLTSSRADYGIYLPLLKQLKDSKEIDLQILAFGTHLSKFHGYSIEGIIEDGFEVNYTISSLVLGDTKGDISNSYALTAQKFADFWSNHSNDFDLVFVLGDRFEMAAAVAAGIPFNVEFAHIHGGETTTGAIDNIYRHSITLASKIHLVSLIDYKKRVESLTGASSHSHVVGALSLDNLKNVKLLNKIDFQKKWNIDASIPFILITVHPETVSADKNQLYSDELLKCLLFLALDNQLVITMPNADTLGSLYRAKYKLLKQKFPEKVTLIENFGTQSYFTAMKYAKFLLGNTSSGIIEAASFNKFVINIGDRQKGRVAGENVIHTDFKAEAILKVVEQIGDNQFKGENIYFKGNASEKIAQIIEKL
ncbi:UDP-N-acetylglucosamine 2-epimerase [uncultured Marivirga sp.]|uniref:UDP-N-acetylglucosamine 2-epimerase n=1 Tax=uncultured Marivirga sp. TaxID=1123707 RepID=UPI0030EE8B34